MQQIALREELLIALLLGEIFLIQTICPVHQKGLMVDRHMMDTLLLVGFVSNSF